MKTKNRAKGWILLVWIIPCLLTFSKFFLCSSAQSQNLELWLEKISQRAESYPKYKNWKATVVSTETEMDKNWNPKKLTVVTKNIQVLDKERNEEILKALETKKGITTDITAKYIQEAREREEKSIKRRAEQKEKKEEKGEERSLSLSLNNLLPFGEKNRVYYDFTVLEDSSLNGRAVHVIEARVINQFVLKDQEKQGQEENEDREQKQEKEKEESFWEGKYYIDASAFDLLKMEIKPAKKQKFVKELSLEMDFQLLEGGHYVLKKSRMLINAGFLVKHIRMTVEEEYSRYEIIS